MVERESGGGMCMCMFGGVWEGREKKKKRKKKAAQSKNIIAVFCFDK